MNRREFLRGLMASAAVLPSLPAASLAAQVEVGVWEGPMFFPAERPQSWGHLMEGASYMFSDELSSHLKAMLDD